MPKIKSMTRELTSKSFQKEVLNNEHPVIVQFCNRWNGACQIFSPIYEELDRAYEGRVSFYNVDIEKESVLEKEYRIVEVPTILIFDRGYLIDYSKGLIPRNNLIEKIENALQQSK